MNNNEPSMIFNMQNKLNPSDSTPCENIVCTTNDRADRKKDKMVFEVFRDSNSCGKFLESNHREAANKAFIGICDKEGKSYINNKKIFLECRRIIDGDAKFYIARLSPPTEEKPYSNNVLDELFEMTG